MCGASVLRKPGRDAETPPDHRWCGAGRDAEAPRRPQVVRRFSAEPAVQARAAPDARRRLTERRVREGVQRLLQLVQLAGDEREAVLALGRAVQAFELVGDPVETLEQGIELAISDVALLHGPNSTSGAGGRHV